MESEGRKVRKRRLGKENQNNNVIIGRIESVETNRCKISSDQVDPVRPGKSPRLIPAYRIRREQDSLQFRVDFISPELSLSQDRKKRSNLTRKLACLLHNLPPSPLYSLYHLFFFLSLSSHLLRPISSFTSYLTSQYDPVSYT
jgi:hypothetical protein